MPGGCGGKFVAIHLHRALHRRVLPSAGPHEDGAGAGAGVHVLRERGAQRAGEVEACVTVPLVIR